MNILIIQGDPDNKSFCHANALNYYHELIKINDKVKFVDLSIDNFDPVLRYGYRKHMTDETYPNKMQKLINETDHIVFFFPIWWPAEPSILKGWIERVLTPGFAYKYPTGPLLNGKTATICTTSQSPSSDNSKGKGIMLRWKDIVLGFCGIKLKNFYIMGDMDTDKDTLERRKSFMKECTKDFK